jgi:rod shape-determining protein MreC
VLEARWTRAVLIVLLVVAVALITIDFRDSGNSGAHGVGGRVFGPVESLAGKVTGLFSGSGNSGEVARLQKQNDALQAELAQARTSDDNAGQLARLLHISGSYRLVTAAVIAAGGNYSDTVTINVGRAAGVAANETVLNGNGLVGTVVSVTSGTATVQLLTDAGTTVGIRAGGQIGALTGTARSLSGSAPLKLTMFSTTATLKPGEQIVTFGSVGGRPYVPGVPVGTVSSVTTQPGSLTPTAVVRPFADFTGLGVVGVVVSP